MRPDDYLDIYIEVPVTEQAGALTWVHFTDGLININITRGVPDYEGGWVMPDTGQLVLTSRNNQLDPSFNSNILNKRRIKVVTTVNEVQETIFIGRVDSIQSKYQPRDAAPIIRLVAFDILADLSRTPVTIAVKDGFALYPPVNTYLGGRSGTCGYLLQYMNANSLIPQMELGTVNIEYIGPAGSPNNTIAQNNRIPIGQSYYDALTTYARGNSGFWFAARDGKLNYRWRDIPAYTLAAEFDSRQNQAGKLPYRDLNLTDGFGKIYNSLTLTREIQEPDNTTINTTTQTYTNAPSIDVFGKIPLEINTVVSFQPDYLAISPFPHKEITQLVWNGNNDILKATTLDIGDFINIYYEYGSLVINKDYQIVGLTHEVTANEWIISYELRNWEPDTLSPTIPIITSNRTTTDQATAVQFNLSNYAAFYSQVWTLGDGTTSTAQNPSKVYANPGTYTVSCTGTTPLGQVATSAPITITVTNATPVISGTDLRFTSLPQTNHTYTIGQYYFWADGIQYETSNDWGFHFATNPERRTTTNDVYPIGPFQIMQRSTDTVLPGNKVTRSLRLQASNVVGTATKETSMDLDLATFNTQVRSARYILVRRYSSQSTYKYQSSSTLNDTSDVVRIKNVRVLDANQTNIALNKPVVAAGNNNGLLQTSTLTSGNFTTWDIGTAPNLITDGNDSTFARITTTLGPYTASAPRGAGWLCQPDHYFIIDLGSVMSFTQINVEFSNEEGFPTKEQTPVGVPGSRGNVGYQVFYSDTLPAVNGFGATYHAEYKSYPFPGRGTTVNGHAFPIDTCVASKLPIN